MVTHYPQIASGETFIGGADVLLPRWDVIRPKIQQAFANPQLAKEDAHLSVQNGTTIAGNGCLLNHESFALVPGGL